MKRSPKSDRFLTNHGQVVPLHPTLAAAGTRPASRIQASGFPRRLRQMRHRPTMSLDAGNAFAPSLHPALATKTARPPIVVEGKVLLQQNRMVPVI